MTDPRVLPRSDQYPELPGQRKHKWGQTALYNDNATIQSYQVYTETPKVMFTRKKREVENIRPLTAERYLEVAEWALKRGLIKECQMMISEAAKLPDPSPKAKAILAACERVDASYEKPYEGTEAVTRWRERLADFQVTYSDKGHYAIFFKGSGPVVPEDVRRRLEKMENHLHGFYLWFALKGQSLPFSPEKLVAIQVDSPDSFRAQRAVLDLAGISEGFFAPRDNVAVYCSRRIDDAYLTFSELTRSYTSEGWSQDQLLRGREIPNLKKGIKDSGSRKDFLGRDYPRMQTIALLDRALQEEAELAAVSHEGTRQLALATGLAARGVVLPEWISFGFASLFETPKGPFAGADGTAQVAFWVSYGAPSWAYVRQFKSWAISKDEYTKLDPAPDALRKTVTDAYFHRTRLPQNLELDVKLSKTEREKREKEIARAKEELFRAKAHAWALNYHLAKTHMDEYLAFLRTMNTLPRDLELDDQTLLLTFARAFKLTNATDDGIDEGKFNAFAKEWIDKVAHEESPVQGFKLDDPKKPAPAGGPGGPAGGPGNPGAPGGAGFPGGPGGY